jgi:hypothetical protein
MTLFPHRQMPPTPRDSALARDLSSFYVNRRQ